MIILGKNALKLDEKEKCANFEIPPFYHIMSKLY